MSTFNTAVRTMVPTCRFRLPQTSSEALPPSFSFLTGALSLIKEDVGVSFNFRHLTLTFGVGNKKSTTEKIAIEWISAIFRNSQAPSSFHQI
jgi:hypothetical protein